MSRQYKDSRRKILCAGVFAGIIIIVLLIVLIVIATKDPDCSPSEKKGPKDNTMPITVEDSYGQIDGQNVKRYTLTNNNNVEVKIIDYGGIITKVMVPDNQGVPGDIVLGFADIEGYKTNAPYLGALIGRYANRIANGTFSIDGTTYTLAINNGPNALHGGTKGFDKRVWQSSISEGKLVLTYVSADMEEGYPGEVTATVTYQLTNTNELIIDYSAATTKSTVINLTNHAYFNLQGEGSGDVLEHLAQVNADSYLPVDDTSIPTGVITPVQGTVMDLRTKRKLADVIDQVPGDHGYDHNYCFGKTGWVKNMARVEDPSSGRYVEAHSTEPGMQFYTAYWNNVTGKGGKHYGQYSGFCLETQHYPDSPNKPDFPTVVLAPGETYRQTTTYKFGTSS
ncbi:aldose 1-epimerase-like isoform X1 [Mizuhopecten yessoensis]|uniref:Aldose 1-epimerase n=2 Tax=Mizuhopecten yessoensis TaxID=6573 RepID=A0A210QQ41_MIZYE|nr:aldose 1-epimerase-like isoform X1 [Mizuhopecten yessoensis]OWF50818.1 Aldose 1-epimerase [Mizuhopecten yessoensis]